jgi:hypothetical protein
MKRITARCLRREHFRRALKVGGSILGLILAVKAIAFLELILVKGAPAVARDDARREEQRREIDFLTQTEGSATMALKSCPESLGWPTRPTGRFLHDAQNDALSDRTSNQRGWKPVCGYVYDSAKSNMHDDPRFLCVTVHELIGWKDIEGAGYTCLDGDGSWGRWPHQWKLIPSEVVTSYADEYDKPKDGANIPNVRLKVEKCSLDASRESCLVTLWVTGERSSWGSDLVAEYAADIRFAVLFVLMILGSNATALIRIVRRVIVVSKQRDPDSAIPWIIEVPLRAAALDHDPFTGLNNALERYEDDYANRGPLKWSFLVCEMPNVMSDLIAHRISYSIERSWANVAAKGKRVWTKAARLLS